MTSDVRSILLSLKVIYLCQHSQSMRFCNWLGSSMQCMPLMSLPIIWSLDLSSVSLVAQLHKSLKLQATVATSLTTAKFIAAVHAAELAKYLCAMLFEFGALQDGPAAPLYEDNISAIAMIYEWKPTSNSQHMIDIQYFAIQKWQHHGIIVMHHLPGVINVVNQVTKALGWMLHSCHAHLLMMGHCKPP
jgi:hypothetical protein